MALVSRCWPTHNKQPVAEADTKNRRLVEEAERVQCIEKGNATERQEVSRGGGN